MGYNRQSGEADYHARTQEPKVEGVQVRSVRDRGEALPTGTTDLMGGTHYVYTTPKGWWSITTREGMLLFCPDEAVTIVAGEIIDAMDDMEVQP
jgi:hypothetical protein